MPGNIYLKSPKWMHSLSKRNKGPKDRIWAQTYDGEVGRGSGKRKRSQLRGGGRILEEDQSGIVTYRPKRRVF